MKNMTTLRLSNSLLDGYVALFRQLDPKDKTILLDSLAESQSQNYGLEKEPDPTSVEAARQIFGAWSGEENRQDVEQMLRAIADNRMLEREVKL
jgi:hypothetical protein